ncbi:MULTISPECIES: antitermination protein N [unclassified Pantoea]|uniref:transcriptional antitermination N peptide n=1 Tax=unclassified Pantoea TaxID=2630326 RepID=UPI001CD310C8|nr:MULTISPECIES: antitermination protein N [unclassified Pantoea]MCA1178905.1 antitermination protein N [Pantoea sp. alder69]MCA1253782.1 antitermination protein N [Pantoea sp. alder70]MCA1267394.1 antitermination protein N [Pantoea sp. alder81]
MTRRTQFTGSAAGRRRERRAGLQSEVSNSSEVMHRPTPNRVLLQCKRQVTPSVNRAVDTETEYHKQILAGAAKYIGGEVQDGMCLPEIAIFAAGYRTVRKGAVHITK